MFDFILSLLSPTNVASIVKSLHKLVDRLDKAEAKLLAKADKHATAAQNIRANTAAKVTALYAARDEAVGNLKDAYRSASDEAAKAASVAAKIKDLIS
jgi:hypothetical protein